MFTANSAVANYSGQSLCLYSIKNLKYYSNSWFIYSICPSICGWNAVDNLVSIPSILFNSFIYSATNCGLLLLITLSSNPWSFHILFLNNLARPFTDVSFVVAIKYAIFNNLLYTSKITSFPATYGNLVIKSTIKYVHAFSSTSFAINFPTGISISFFIPWYKSHLSTYFPTSFVTPGHQ